MLIDTNRLPVIDLSWLERGGAWRDQVAAQVDRAAGGHGCFYVTGHGVEPSVIDAMLGQSQSVFRMRADALRSRPGAPLHARNLFPEPPGLKEATLDYMQALTGLGHKLMSCIGRGLHLGDSYFVDRYTGEPQTRFGIVDHPAGERLAARSVGGRTDRGLFALLFQDETGGLQIRHRSSWLDVPYVPHTLVVTVGDSLETLTEGRYASVAHRVVSHPHRSRVSMPFYFESGSAVGLPQRHTPGLYAVASGQ
jgi:isopenicillin N synthase-like dioxygenase